MPKRKRIGKIQFCSLLASKNRIGIEILERRGRNGTNAFDKQRNTLGIYGRARNKVVSQLKCHFRLSLSSSYYCYCFDLEHEKRVTQPRLLHVLNKSHNLQIGFGFGSRERKIIINVLLQFYDYALEVYLEFLFLFIFFQYVQ